MRKYQEPQMNVLMLEEEDIITSSTDLGLSGSEAGGSGTGGTDTGDWNDFWN